MQRQPLLILMALLAKPGETVTREELRELVWPENVFVDYEHSLNRSMGKLRRALGDRVAKPRYIETVHGRGYRFIAPVERGASACQSRLAVLPVQNLTGIPENDDLADEITEALIDGSRCAVGEQVRVIALTSVMRFKKKRARLAGIAAELRTDYLVCGRLRSDDGLFRLRVELVDARDRTLRWAESFLFTRDRLGQGQEEILNEIVDRFEKEFAAPQQPEPIQNPEAELLQAK